MRKHNRPAWQPGGMVVIKAMRPKFTMAVVEAFFRTAKLSTKGALESTGTAVGTEMGSGTTDDPWQWK